MDENKVNENEQEAYPKYVEIPRGWSRILENGSILYISPSSNRLRCRDQVVDYLTTGGTCKCGLECPLHIDKVFVFDAKVPSKLIDQHADHPKWQSSCQHCEGNMTQKEMPPLTSHSTASPSAEPKFESSESKLLPSAALSKAVLEQKKAPVRSRKSALDVNKQPKVSVSISLQTKEPSKGNMYSSISNSLGSVTKASPVQNVPTNLATSNQGPLPSFASIVSSFKFFKPGLETGSRVGNSTGLTTGTADVKATTAMSSTVFSVPSSVQRTATKTVTFVGMSASNAQQKTIQQVTSKSLAKPRNIAVQKSAQTVQVTSSGSVTPHTNVPTVTAALATKSTSVTLPTDVRSASTTANVAASIPASLVSVSKMASSTTAPTYTAVVSSSRSVPLATSLVSKTPISLSCPSLQCSTVVETSSVSTCTSPAAVMVSGASGISFVSPVAAPGSQVASVVNSLQLKANTSLATPEVARNNLVVTSTASQSGSLINSLQPVTARAPTKATTKPAVRSRVTKPKTTLVSRKQGLKALANVAAGFFSTVTSENATTSSVVTSPLQASSNQSSILKTNIPSSVTAPVMTPALWNPAMMARNSQSSQQAHSQSFLSGAWSSVLSPNVSNSSLMGLRHPPPSATAPTIVTATASLSNKVESQSTVTPVTAATTASTLIKSSLSVSHTSITSTRPQLSVPFLTSANQQSFSTSSSQTPGESQGSGLQLKLTAQNMFSQSQVMANANQGVVSAVPPVQPAIVAPIPSNLFYQNAAINQMYNPQALDMNQLKAFGQYQVQWPTLYPSHLATNAMVLATSQEKSATTPTANISQHGYPNPFMFGIIMPTPQPSTVGMQTPTQSVTGATVNQTMAPSVASTAVAAAYGSYVPIAPAATPRFSQTLAHLANAYNPYGSNVRSTAPPSNQLQFTYRMMQIASGGMGNTIPVGSAGAPNPSISDQSLKYPLSSVKQMYGSTVSSVSTSATTSGMVKTSVSTALQTPAQTVVAAMPYVPSSTQAGSVQSSFTFTPASTAMGAPARAPLASGIPVQPYAYGMMTAATNIDPKTGNTTFGYLLIPPSGEAISSSASETTSDLCTATKSTGSSIQTTSSGGVQNEGVSKTSVFNTQHMSPSTGSLSLASSSVLTTPSSSLWTPWSTTAAGAAHSTSENNPVPSHTLSYSSTNSNSSPIHTPFSPTLTVQIATNRSSTIQQSHPYSTSNIHDVKSDPQSKVSPHSTPYEKCGSPFTESKGMKRPYFDDVTSDKVISNSEKRTKYDFQPSRFVETDPLLGMKRSCEAIEVYPIHKESGKNKCSDNENCGEGNSDYDDDVEDDDPPMLVTETLDKLRKSSAEPPVEAKTSSLEVEKVPVSTGYNSEHLSDPEAQNGDVEEEPQHRELPDVRADGLIAKLRDSAEYVECLPTPQVRPHFGIGDIVWAQARGLPSWPGKIVDEAVVGKGRPDDGKRWVMWFGDHTFSQVEVDRLKTLTEGLRSLDDKGKKKKYRAKKARIGLEQAISEALEELDKREQLKVKQSAKVKPKKKRVR